jgi:hypothetical protein
MYEVWINLHTPPPGLFRGPWTPSAEGKRYYREMDLSPEASTWMRNRVGRRAQSREQLETRDTHHWMTHTSSGPKDMTRIWPKDNSRPYWQVLNEWEQRNHCVVFTFKSASSAMLFKLTWGGR